MNLEQMLESLLALFKSSGNDALFIVYAIVGVLLTQLVKKLFINKTKVEVLHRFNMASILPFILGVLSAIFDALVVDNSWQWNTNYVYSLLVSGITIGALSVVMFRLISSLMGGDLSTLLKDDVFGVFYNQLVYFGTVKSQLESGKLKFSDFLTQIKLITSNAKEIYRADSTDLEKKSHLFELLSGIITTDNIVTVVDAIHKALIASSKTDDNKTTK